MAKRAGISGQVVEDPIKAVSDAAVQAARVESEPPHVRHYRAILFQGTLIAVACAFGLLTFLVKTMPSFTLDLEVTRAIQMIGFPVFGSLMTIISWAGFAPQNIIITALIVLAILAFGLQWEAVMAVIAAIFSTLVNLLVKDLVQRPRPGSSLVNVVTILNSYSFPSGHVMYYLGFFGFVWFLAFTLMKPTFKRGILLVFFGIPIALIGISRIYLGEHWASDVLGAYLLGTLTLVAIIQFYRWGKSRYFVHQPVAPSNNQDA